MTVVRRRLVLTLGFLSLSVALSSVQVHAQQGMKKSILPPPVIAQSHPWDANLTPEQLKEALSRYGQGQGDPGLDEFEKTLGKMLADQFPGVDPAILKGLLNNKELMEKAKQIAKQKAGKSGEDPQLSKEKIDKLLKSIPKEKLPPALDQQPEVKTPQTNENQPPPPFQPQGPPKQIIPSKPIGKSDGPFFPKQDPNNPENPKPMGGIPDCPKPNNPAFAPDQGNGNPFFPDNNPFGQPDEPTDPRAKSASALASLWERNIGPLDQTPEVKRALFDLMSGENGFDFDIKDEKGNSFWDALKNDKGENSPFSDFLNESGNGGENWNFSKFDLPTIGWDKWFGSSSSSSSSDWQLGSSSPRPPQLPESSSSSWGFGGSGGGLSGSWFSVVLLGLVVLGALLLWWYLRDTKTPESAAQANGLGPWPIDPHAINTREDVVKAFEYLSVLICGPAARMWTHSTIAEALTNLAITQGEVAVKLARLYELARYAPLDEPLTRNEVIEARHIVCDLAEVV